MSSKPAAPGSSTTTKEMEQAIQSVRKNIKFKRLLIFSLKSVADLCLQGDRKRVENSFCVVDSRLIETTLDEIVTLYVDSDPEIISHVGRIVYGVAKAVDDDDPTDVKKKDFQSQKPYNLLSRILQSGSKALTDDPESIQACLKAVLLIDTVLPGGWPVHDPAIAKGILTFSEPVPGIAKKRQDEQERLKMSHYSDIMKALSSTMKTDSEALAVADSTFPTAVTSMAVAIQRNGSDTEYSDFCCNLFRFLQSVQSKSNKAIKDPTVASNLTAIMDKIQTRRITAELGSQTLAMFLSPETLKASLESMKQAKSTEETLASLALLSGMAYIADFNSTIVEAGGVPALCSVILSVSKSYDPQASASQTKGIVGACKVLKSIAADPSQRAAIIKEGGLDALVALAQKEKLPMELRAAICDALSQLAVGDSKSCGAIAASGVIQQLWDVSLKSSEDKIKAGQLCACLSRLCCSILEQNFKAMSPIIEKAFDKQIIKAMDTFKESPEVQDGCLSLISAMLASGIQAPASLRSVESINTICASLDSCESPAKALVTVKILEKFVQLDMSNTKAIESSNAPFALLATLGKFSQNAQIKASASASLDAIASEANVVTALNQLAAITPKANKEPLETKKVIASIRGLSAIPRLKSAVLEKKAANALLKSVEAWVGSVPPPPEADELILAAVDSVASIMKGCNPSNDELETIMNRIMTICGSSTLKSIVPEKQTGGPNCVVGMLSCLSDIVETGRAPNSLSGLIDTVQNIMRRYADHRGINLECMRLLNEIASTENSENAKKVVQTGASKQVLGYIQRAVVYEDVQKAAIKLFTTCAKKDDSCIEGLKKNGVMDVLKVVGRAHSKNVAIQKSIGVLSSLMTPDEFVHGEVQEYIELLDAARKNRDVLSGAEALVNLSNLTVNNEAAKLAAKSKLGAAMTGYFEAARQPPTIQIEDMNSSHVNAAIIIRNIANVGKPSTSFLIQANAINTLQAMIQDAHNSQNSKKKLEAISGCIIAATSLLNAEKSPQNAPGAKELALFIQNTILPNYGNDISIVPAALACMAIASDPAAFQTNEVVGSSIEFIANKMDDSKHPSKRIACLTGLELLIQSSSRNPETAEVVISHIMESKAVPKLVGMLEAYSDDEELVKLIRKVLTRLTKTATGAQGIALRNALVAAGGQEMLDFACKAVGRNLGMCLDQTDAALSTLNIMNNMTNKKDRFRIESAGVLQQCHDLIELHPDNAPIRVAVGQLLQNVGADEALDNMFLEIISILKSDMGDSAKIQKLNDILAKIPLYVQVQTADVDQTFKNSIPAIQALSAFIAKHPYDDIQFVQNTASVGRSLAERFTADPGSKYGAQQLKTTLLPTLNVIFCDPDPKNKSKKSKPFTKDACLMMAEIANNETTRQSVINEANRTRLLKNLYDKLDMYSSDPDVSAAIIKLLATLASRKDGMALIEDPNDKDIADRHIGDQLADTVVSFITKYYASAPVQKAGFDYLCNHVANGKNGIPPCLTNLVGVEHAAFKSVAGMEGYSQLLCQMIAREGHNPSIRDAVQRAISRYKVMKDDENLSATDKERLGAAIAKLIDAMAEDKMFDDLRAIDALSVLNDIITDHGNELTCVNPVSRAIQKIAIEMPEMRAAIMRKTINIMLTEASHVLESDPITVTCLLSTIATILENDPDTAAYMKEIKGFSNALAQMEALCGSMEEGQEKDLLLDLLQDVRSKIEDASHSVPTLEDVYRRWCARIDQGEELQIPGGDANLLADVEFVVSYTTEYSLETHASTEQELAREFMFGCKCLQLLMEQSVDNMRHCVTAGVPEMLVNAISMQINEQVVQWAVQASLPGVSYPEGEKAWSKAPKVASVMVDAISRVMHVEDVPMVAPNKNLSRSHASFTNILEVLQPQRKATSLKNQQTELLPDHELQLIQRLDMMAHIAVDRQFYNGTAAMEQLINIWDLFDNNKLSVESLIGSMRVMRCIVNDHWLGEIVQRQVPERLLALVDDPDAPSRVLVDALFLLGALAVVPEMKALIGELNGVEKCTELLKRCSKNDKKVNNSKVEQNACLALANIVMGHGKNSNRFGNNKGLKLATKVMESSMTDRVDYDLANAASILMCNLCFKRDDFKAIFGEEGAPESVILTIQKYDGAETINSKRCLISMFKAITNLALLPANVQRFIDAGLAPAMVTFFSNCTNIGDELLSASMKTLSNLVLEFSNEFMTAFAPIIPHVLRLLSGETPRNTTSIASAFEVLANLCRSPDNQLLLLGNDGIPIVLNILNVVKDSNVYSQGLNLLFTVARQNGAAQLMLDSGIISFVLALLDEMEDLEPEVVASGLRCLRKVMFSCKEAANVFPQSGGTDLLLEVFNSACQEAKNDTNALVTVLEGLKIILFMLSVAHVDFPQEPNLRAPIDSAENLRKATEQLEAFAASYSDRVKEFPKSKSGNYNTSVDVDNSSPPTSDVDVSENETVKFVKLASKRLNDKLVTKATANDEDDLPPNIGEDDGETVATGTDETASEKLYKPRDPRRYQIVGIGGRSAIFCTRSILNMLLEDENVDEPFKSDKVCVLSFILITHLVSEKIDGISLPFIETESHLPMITYKIFAKTKELFSPEKVSILTSGHALVVNLLCLVDNEDVLGLASHKQAVGAIKSSFSALSVKKNGELRKNVEDLWALLQLDRSVLSPKMFFAKSSYDYPVEHPDVMAEKYPNGVQDLLPKERKKVRKGGKGSMLEAHETLDKPVVKSFYWRSSPDLMMLTWMNDKKMENYNYRLQVTKIKAIERGTKLTTDFQKYAKAAGVWESCCVGIIANPSPSFPDGLQLSLMFSNRRVAKRFYLYVKEWRDSSVQL